MENKDQYSAKQGESLVAQNDAILPETRVDVTVNPGPEPEMLKQ